jgi:outer membrane protein assembly factor BamB
MKNALLRLGALAGFVLAAAVLQGCRSREIAVTTYHYDNMRTGWNSHETVLSPRTLGPAEVAVNRFGLLGKVMVDDTVYAQPLIVPGVTIARGVFAGSKHDVAYVVTESNTIYAIDANNGVILLTSNLGAAVGPPNGPYHYDCWNNGPHVGIESTPVIDLAEQAMYLISYVMRSDRQPAYALNAIDITTLLFRQPPVIVSASHTLTDGSTFTFNANEQRQRAALLLEDGNIYAAFASWCDRSEARGWLLGWRAQDLQLLHANILTNVLPTGSRSRRLSTIWMSGYGVAAVAGHLYFSTGNAPDTTYDAHNNPSETVIKVTADLASTLDFFTPFNVGSLDPNDRDLSSGGVLLLPDQPGRVPRMAAVAGKEGSMYLLNRENMGRFSPTVDNVLGEYTIEECYCGQSYYLNKIVSSGGREIGVWQINTSPSPSLTKIYKSDYLGGSGDGGFFTSISSNSAANAIIWAVSRGSNDAPMPTPTSPPCVFPFPQTSTPCLFAFQPIPGNPQLKLLFSAPAGNWQVPRPADAVDAANSNIVPVVANGHVYVASYRELDIFGFGPQLIQPSAPPPPAPVPVGLHKTRSGIITKVERQRFTMKTEAGAEVRVDAEKAFEDGFSPELVIGQAVSVYGDTDARGVVHAEVIKRARVPRKR